MKKPRKVTFYGKLLKNHTMKANTATDIIIRAESLHPDPMWGRCGRGEARGVFF
jgi:hypothetical protein